MKRKSFLKQAVGNWLLPFLDPRQLVSIFQLPLFFAEWLKFRRSGGGNAYFSDLRPCLMDRVRHTPFDPHYFYQAAWIARYLTKEKPDLHIDVGSSIGLVGVLSAQSSLVFVDYRPLQVQLPGLTTIAGDMTRLPFRDTSVRSMSSLHVIEHVGLGRYGDPIDPEGWVVSLRELARVLTPGGRLYLSTPVGRERVCFNAHRVFAPSSILNALPQLKLENFALVDDAGTFESTSDLSRAENLEYGCGMFALIRV